MSDCPQLIDAESWLDGEAGDRADEIARHIALCAACKAHVDALRRSDFVAREAMSTTPVPDHLLSRLDDIDAAAPVTQPRTISRRMALGGFAVAASVAGLGAFALSRNTANGDLPMAVFGDFATHIDADQKLDIVEANPMRITEWFSGKVPFPMPALASLTDLTLTGGRLCWLLDRRLAALNFEREGRGIGLYLTAEAGLTDHDGNRLPGPGSAPVSESLYGVNGVFWHDGTLAYSLVGQTPPDTIATLAADLRAANAIYHGGTRT